jgi:L-asparaginase
MIVVANNEATSGIPLTSRMLGEGRPLLDALEAGIRLVEEDEKVRTVAGVVGQTYLVRWSSTRA